jgi:hypothetical protein
MLPVNSTIDVTRLLMSIAFANTDNKRQLREKELDSQISRMKIEADTYLEEMRISAQKEVYSSLTELSRHAFDRKMDFL